MATTSRAKKAGKAGRGTAAGWPEWTDEVRIGLGPAPDGPLSEADRAFWAAQNAEYHVDEPSPAELLTANEWAHFSRLFGDPE